MLNKRCSVDQRINGQRTYHRTTEVVPSSELVDSKFYKIFYDVHNLSTVAKLHLLPNSMLEM